MLHLHTKSVFNKMCTVFRAKKWKHISVFKHVYYKKILLLLPFRDSFRDARLHLSKYPSHIIFASKYVYFFRFHIYYHQKGLFAKIRSYFVTNSVSISKDFLAIRRHSVIWRYQDVNSDIVLKSCCWTRICCNLMISSRYSSLTSACCRNVCLTHTGYDCPGRKYPLRDCDLI